MNNSVKNAFVFLAKYPGRWAYGLGSPLLRLLCRTEPGRRRVEKIMRFGGKALFWGFSARRETEPGKVQAEWVRILRGIGLSPEPGAGASGSACSVCFSKCSLGLRAGDGSTCDTVMAVNDELILSLGGRMVLEERLTDPGASRCVVRIDPRDAPPVLRPTERALWCDAPTAQIHFDRAAEYYDYIMGFFEIPTNDKATRGLVLSEGMRVLDLGVGTGLSLVSLMERLPPDSRLTAVDSSGGMLSRARRRAEKHGYARRVEFVNADAESTGLPPASIDLVFSSFLLDLVDAGKRRSILGEIKRLLKPGGRARIAVMDGEAAGLLDRVLAGVYNLGYGRWNPVWRAFCAGYAPHCRPIAVQGLLAEEGFEVLRRERSYVTFFPVAIYTLQKRLKENREE